MQAGLQGVHLSRLQRIKFRLFCGIWHCRKCTPRLNFYNPYWRKFSDEAQTENV